MKEPMNGEHQLPEADLARLADGTLPPGRADELRRQAVRSPALAAALAEQERAVNLLRVTDVPAPDSLRATVGAQLRAAPRRRRLRLGALAPALAVAAALVIVLISGGSPAAPILAQTVRVSLAAAVFPAPAPRTATVLAASQSGIPFPDWSHDLGWRSTGARHDVIDGRSIETVFYADRTGRRVGYAIVSGEALPVAGGHRVAYGTVSYRLLRLGGATLITWQRSGHTCVIAGRSVNPGTLLHLASAA